MDVFKAFKQRLEELPSAPTAANGADEQQAHGSVVAGAPLADAAEDEEANLCDLHFVPNCQSCRSWDDAAVKVDAEAEAEGEDGPEWMAHQLSFARDLLGKDLEWKRRMAEIEVIDPKEKARSIKEERRGKGKGRERGRA